MVPAAIETWKSMLAAHDPAVLQGLIAEHAVFESPVVHTPQQGKAKVVLYLAAADRVLNNGSFRYVAEWYGERSAVLEFNAVVDGIMVDGVDMIWWGEDDRIVRFKVMVRPLKAIDILHQKMAQTLEGMLSKPG